MFIPVIIFYIYKVFHDGEQKNLKYLYLFILLQSFIFIELSVFVITSIIIQLLLEKKTYGVKKIHIANFIVLTIVICIFMFNNFNEDNYFSNADLSNIPEDLQNVVSFASPLINFESHSSKFFNSNT